MTITAASGMIILPTMKARSSLYRPLLGRNQGRGRHVDATGRGSPRPSRRLSEFERGLALLPDLRLRVTLAYLPNV
jgi:hypothetical protein